MHHGDTMAVATPVVGGDPQVPLSLLGDSPAVQGLRAAIEAAVAAPCVLIEAEDGLDVADIALDVHARDPRGGPFVEVNCADAEPARVEQELFGQGPHLTGELECVEPRSAVARAVGGTLLLTDLRELSAAAQGRLARMVRDGEVQVGAAHVRLDVRLIASTAGDGDPDGRLRRDLLRHLERMRLVVPPLRRRAEDIPTLVDRLVAETHDAAGHVAPRVAPPAMTLLAAMPWRGNLVELRAAVARIVGRRRGDVIELEDVLSHAQFDGLLFPHAPTGTLREAREQFERDYIRFVLRHHQWRVPDAARTLGMQRTNLYRKARQLGVTLSRPGGQS